MNGKVMTLTFFELHTVYIKIRTILFPYFYLLTCLKKKKHPVTCPVFFGQTNANIKPRKVPPWLVQADKFSKFVPPDTLKMHSQALPVLRFL